MPSSDVVRKELVGIPSTTRAPQSGHSAEMNRQSYLELQRRAAAEEPVVVDDTFRFAADRQAFAPPRALPPRAPSESTAERPPRSSRAARRRADRRSPNVWRMRTPRL